MDLIFENKKNLDWGSKKSEKIYESMFAKIMPNYLITNPVADRFWKLKQLQTKMIGARMLLDKRKKDASSTRIVNFFAGEM